jgi:tRNA(Ile)-lysidine synthase
VVGGVQVAVERRGALRAAHWVLVVRPRARRGRSVEAPPATVSPLPAGEQVRLGAWQLRALDRAPTAGEVDEGRVAWLSSDRRYVVRSWAAGDRWSPAPGVAARRVKRFFADRRVPAAARAGWPVVAVAAAPDGSGGEIVWVPGVRRSSAAPARPGQPGFYLLCERTPERCVRL